MSQCADRYGANHFVMSPNNHISGALQQRGGGYYCNTGQQHQQHMTSLTHSQHTNYMMGCFTQNPNGWAGVPLISTATRRPRRNNNNNNNINYNGNVKQRLLVSNNTYEFDENAMSRLAIHAHGAPLILSGRYRNRTQKRDNVNNKMGNLLLNNNNTCNKNTIDISTKCHNNVNSVEKSVNKSNCSMDSICATSDESSSNGTSPEACLPRIIKPRKRRKKDRKAICNINENILAQKKQQQQHQEYQNQQNSNHETNIHQIIQYGYNNTMNNDQGNYIQFNTDQEIASPQSIGNFSTNLQNNDEDLASSTCCCRLCDPSCRIWAFPLRRSCSDNSAEIDMHKHNKNVGVIGSNRSRILRNEWKSISHIDQHHQQEQSRNSSFSDSGDSGCDILSGINFGDDLFNISNSNDQIGLSFQTTNLNCDSIPNSENFINFPTAESLLTESINEISKKLMETVDLRNDIFSSDNSSVFSDSVLSDDVLLNLETLSKGASLFCTTNNLNSNNDSSDNNSNNLYNQHFNNLFSDNFVVYEKDRENEILNCFDMVWNGPKLIPIEERIQLQSNG